MLEFSYNLLFPIKKKLLTSQRFQNLRKAVLALMLFPSAIDQTRVLKYTKQFPRRSEVAFLRWIVYCWIGLLAACFWDWSSSFKLTCNLLCGIFIFFGGWIRFIFDGFFSRQSDLRPVLFSRSCQVDIHPNHSQEKAMNTYCSNWAMLLETISGRAFSTQRRLTRSFSTTDWAETCCSSCGEACCSLWDCSILFALDSSVDSSGGLKIDNKQQ